jgi:hypothetical protein
LSESGYPGLKDEQDENWNFNTKEEEKKIDDLSLGRE